MSAFYLEEMLQYLIFLLDSNIFNWLSSLGRCRKFRSLWQLHDFFLHACDQCEVRKDWLVETRKPPEQKSCLSSRLERFMWRWWSRFFSSTSHGLLSGFNELLSHYLHSSTSTGTFVVDYLRWFRRSVWIVPPHEVTWITLLFLCFGPFSCLASFQLFLLPGPNSSLCGYYE